ncbi:MAG: hypothetical protein KW802_02420, partial [Candidatus Doudnabacteria bacterium]|nr:hypothetical protein [Candidatus Doudnabacteria bacterium]
MEKTIDDLGFSGKLLTTDHDYLNIIGTNLGGTKTDLKIEQSVDLKSKVLSDGSIINSLNITRSNLASVNNKTYIRVLVPLGSEFVSAKGFDPIVTHPSAALGLHQDPDLAVWDKGVQQSDVFIRTETGKTEFAGWLAVEPGASRTVTIN